MVYIIQKVSFYLTDNSYSLPYSLNWLWIIFNFFFLNPFTMVICINLYLLQKYFGYLHNQFNRFAQIIILSILNCFKWLFVLSFNFLLPYNFLLFNYPLIRGLLISPDFILRPYFIKLTHEHSSSNQNRFQSYLFDFQYIINPMNIINLLHTIYL